MECLLSMSLNRCYMVEILLFVIRVGTFELDDDLVFKLVVDAQTAGVAGVGKEATEHDGEFVGIDRDIDVLVFGYLLTFRVGDREVENQVGLFTVDKRVVVAEADHLCLVEDVALRNKLVADV